MRRNTAPPNPQAKDAAALIAQAKEQDRAIVSPPPPGKPADTAAAAAARKELAYRAAAAAKELLSPAPPQQPPQPTGIDYRYAGQGQRRRPPLPSADIIAARLGFSLKGNGHWRGPSLCCGDSAGAGARKRRNNPAYSIQRRPDGSAHVWCYKCDDGRAAYAALRNALGMDGADWTPAVAAADDAAPAPKGNDGPPPPSAAVIRKYLRRANRHKQRPPPPEYRMLPAAPGWPELKAAGVSYKKQLAAIPGTFTAYTDYQLADGGWSFSIRPYPAQPGRPKTFWPARPEGMPARSRRGLAPALFHQAAVGGDTDGAGDSIVRRDIIAEGEQAAAAIACAGPPPGDSVYAAWATAGMQSLNLDGLTGRELVIWADNDAPNRKRGESVGAGGKAAQELARLGYAAGYERVWIVRLSAVAGALLIDAAGDFDALAAPDFDGAAADDLTPESVRWILQGGNFTLQEIKQGETLPSPEERSYPPAPLPLPPPPQIGERACHYRMQWHYKDAAGKSGIRYIECRRCAECLAQLAYRDTLRYIAGLMAADAECQTIIRYPAPADEARRFHIRHSRRMDKQLGGAAADNVRIYAAGELIYIYPWELPERAAALTQAALDRAGKGTLEIRPVSAPEFRELAPAYRMTELPKDAAALALAAESELDGGDDDDAAGPPPKKIRNVVFGKRWQARFDRLLPCYGMTDGRMDTESESPPADAESPDTELVKRRRELGPESAAMAHAKDFSVDIPRGMWATLAGAWASRERDLAADAAAADAGAAVAALKDAIAAEAANAAVNANAAADAAYAAAIEQAAPIARAAANAAARANRAAAKAGATDGERKAARAAARAGIAGLDQARAAVAVARKDAGAGAVKSRGVAARTTIAANLSGELAQAREVARLTGNAARTAAARIRRRRINAAVADIRRATGYRGPRALLVDSVDGERAVHHYVRGWVQDDAAIEQAGPPANAPAALAQGGGIEQPAPPGMRCDKCGLAATLYPLDQRSPITGRRIAVCGECR